jgi:hypothetical protein
MKAKFKTFYNLLPLQLQLWLQPQQEKMCAPPPAPQLSLEFELFNISPF